MEVVFPKPRSVSNTREEHMTTYLRQTRPKYEPIELVVDRPKILPSISKVIADIPATSQITSMKPTTYTTAEENLTKFDRNMTQRTFHEEYDEMEVDFETPLVRDSSTTLIANIQPRLELKSVQPTNQQMTKTKIEESTSTYTMERERYPKEEILELRLRKPYIEDSSSVVLANIQPELGVQGQLKPSLYITQSLEESNSMILMDFNRVQQTTPFELIIPRFDVESSTSTVLAHVSPAPAGSRTKVDISNLEKSTSTVLFEQTTRSNREVEMILPKPKQIDRTTSTMIADVEAKYETKNIRPSEYQPEMSTSTVLFDQTIQNIFPQPVELRLKQPTIDDSSTTLFANIKPTLDTQRTRILGYPNQPLQPSSSEILFDTKSQQDQLSEVEVIFPRPLIQESTSVMLANVHPTLDTSQIHVVRSSSFQSPIKSSSQMIVEHDKLDETIVESYLHRQSSSHTVVTESTDTYRENNEMSVLGTSHQQLQPYGSPTIHADLNKPLELVFNVDEGSTSTMSQQYRRGHNSRILGNAPFGRDNNPTTVTGNSFIVDHNRDINNI